MANLVTARINSAPTGAVPAMSMPLAVGSAAVEGGIACFDTANLGAVYRGAPTSTFIAIGRFTETKDNTAGSAAVPVGVAFSREIDLSYWDSVTGANAITSAYIGGTAYISDDHTLTKSSAGGAKAGRVWLVRADGQVGIEMAPGQQL